MFILMFTRLYGTEESIMLVGTFDTIEEARKKMRDEWEIRVNEKGWDREWSSIEDNQAFCGTSDLSDTVRYYIFDTNHPVGFVNDLEDEC